MRRINGFVGARALACATSDQLRRASSQDTSAGGHGGGVGTGANMTTNKGGNMQDKIITGSLAAALSSTTTLTLCHLFVVPLPLGIASSTFATATASGALCAFEGGEGDTGTNFGSVVGVFIGCIGAYYAKSSSEPWRQ